MSVTKILKEAQKDYWRFDRNRDRATQRRQIIQLYNLGFTPAEISTSIGCTDRQVHRAVAAPDWDHGPKTPFQPTVTDDRAQHLEDLVDVALDMADRIRDQDPQIVWDAITRLSRTELQELAMVLAAGIPTDHTKNQLYGWVHTLNRNTDR